VYTFQHGRQLTTSWSKLQVLLRMCAKLLLGGGPQGIANSQLLQGFLRNSKYFPPLREVVMFPSVTSSSSCLQKITYYKTIYDNEHDIAI